MNKVVWVLNFIKITTKENACVKLIYESKYTNLLVLLLQVKSYVKEKLRMEQRALLAPFIF